MLHCWNQNGGATFSTSTRATAQSLRRKSKTASAAIMAEQMNCSGRTESSQPFGTCKPASDWSDLPRTLLRRD